MPRLTPLSIYAFRHGQTDWNKEGRIQGHLDIPLNETGKNEALRLANGLKHLSIGIVLSSDLSRALDTARLTFGEANRNGWHVEVPHLSDARLREVHLGQLQGLNQAEIHEKFGGGLSRRIGSKLLSDEELLGLGSEPSGELLGRVLSAIGEIAEHPELLQGKSLAISTHGGVLRRLLHEAAGIDEIRFPIPNATFFPFTYDPEMKKLTLSDFNPLKS